MYRRFLSWSSRARGSAAAAARIALEPAIGEMGSSVSKSVAAQREEGILGSSEEDIKVIGA